MLVTVREQRYGSEPIETNLPIALWSWGLFGL